MTQRDDDIRQVTSEFSEVFTHIRTAWQAQVLHIHEDLTRSALPVLLMIIRQGPVTATELTCQLQVDKTIVSKAVSQLRSLGLVQAEVSEEDRRVTNLSCTPLAEERINVAREHVADQYRARFAGWSDREVHDFLTSLHRFNMAGRDLASEESAT